MTRSEHGPISHFVSVARLPQNGMPVSLVANDKELKLLAKAHDLVTVKDFRANFLVKKWRKDGVKITGSVEARIVQSCVVTLEPVENAVSSEIDALFVPEGSKLAHPLVSETHEMLIDFEGPDAPETFSGDRIDVGAVAEEFFALAIDPYPRKAGAALEISGDSEAMPVSKPSAFAELIRLRKK